MLTQTDIEQILKDDSDTDTAIRKKCEGVLTDCEVYGDTHCVPPLEDIVDSLIAKIAGLKNVINNLTAAY